MSSGERVGMCAVLVLISGSGITRGLCLLQEPSTTSCQTTTGVGQYRGRHFIPTVLRDDSASI